MNTKFATFSFGCRVNQAELEAISRELTKAGFYYSDDSPDFFIINTCAVTVKAEREVRQYIYQLKKKFPKTKLVVTGCSVTYWQKNNLYRKLPVDMLVLNKDKESLGKLLINLCNQSKKTNISKKEVKDKYQQSGRNIIKIQDGCQRFCSYCIVPYLRGKPKSRKITDIINEINELVKTKEVILTAINTEAYGADTGESLTKLIKEILTKTNISRLSFGSINPWSINDEFISLYKELAGGGRFIDFFHIPLQSGSDKILKLMKRGYNTDYFLRKVKGIRSINDLALIATDVIVGFFDETEKDFKDTYKFIEQSPINKLHVFRYSKRSNTAGYYLAKKLSEPTANEKKRRSQALIALGEKKYNLFLESLIGKTLPGLIINNTVLLSNQVPVLVNDDIYEKKGEIKKIKILKLVKKQLIGRIIS